VRLFIYFFLFYVPLFAQQFFVNGIVKNSKTNEGLSFANVRIIGTTKGTAANINGEYELILNEGNYILVASYIGFKSDTVKIKLDKDKKVNFTLQPVSLELPTVTVIPKENPALRIIKNAIKAKHKREEYLHSYIFKAYTKGVAKTDKDFSASGNSIEISTGKKDSIRELKIMGIIENESAGYFKKPDFYKDIIVARKQTQNTPSTINVITGGRLIQNFYNDELHYFNRPIPSPIADDAPGYYYYYLEDSLALDKNKVYKIYFAPEDASDPGFYGKIYIEDKSFALLKVDVALNEAANPGKIFSKIHIFQQFLPFGKNNIYMPIDYRMFVVGGFLGMVKFAFELNSIMYDYKINPEIKDDFFDMAVVTVLPDADTKDSTYWNNIQKIPNTLEETEAYKRIDSLQSIEKSFWDKFSFFSSRIRWSETISTSGTLNIYSFNKIEGHKLNFEISANGLSNRRLDFNATTGYGFADKKFKYSLSSKLSLGNYRTTTINIRIFNKLNTLFSKSDQYRTITSTVLSLFTHYDFRDYYYSKGFEFRASSEILPYLTLRLGYLSQSDASAVNNSEFSFFRKDRVYKKNQPVYDTDINEIDFGFKLDFRKYIENGFYRSRLQSDSYIIFEGDFRKELGALHYNNLHLETYGSARTFKSANLKFHINEYISNGPIPLQRLNALPGNINGIGKTNTFRTLGIGEISGDMVTTVFLEHNFNDEIFKLLKIPYVKDWQLSLSMHLNVALSRLSAKSKEIIPVKYIEFTKPFVELGFGIGHILFPFRLEFTWRLSYKGENNFTVGLNAGML